MTLLRTVPDVRSTIPTFDHGGLLTELDRLFDAGFPSFQAPARYHAFPIDIYQNNDAVIVRAEMPGFRKEDLQVNVADEALTLSARAGSSDGDTAKGNSVLIERSIALPENLDYRKVEAAYENGVLTVTLPKREETKPATIAIAVK